MEIKYIEFQKHSDARGNLCVGELDKELPFPVKRIYYIYGVDDDKRRGLHAHKKLKQIIFAISGSFRILLDDGEERQEVFLDSPDKGILIDKPTWREIYDFSRDAVLVCLASDVYRVSDYIRDYDEFINYIKEK